MLKWGMIGLGHMAEEFAAELNRHNGIYAVASRNCRKSKDFAKRHSADVSYATYKDLLRDSSVDIVYIATVNTHHYKWIKEALLHDKHVMCEKTIVSSITHLRELEDLASERDLIIVEAMTIYHMPLFQTIRARMNSNDFGKLQMVQTQFGSIKKVEDTNRFYNPELGGGAMLDIGTYALSFISCFVDKPIEINYIDKTMHPYGVDEEVFLHMKAGKVNLLSYILFGTKLAKQATLVFENAYIVIDDYVRASNARIHYTDGRVEEVVDGDTSNAILYEIEYIEEVIQKKCPNYGLKWTHQTIFLIDHILKN